MVMSGKWRVHFEQSLPGRLSTCDSFAIRLGEGEVVGVPCSMRARFHISQVEGCFIVEHPIEDRVLFEAKFPAVANLNVGRYRWVSHFEVGILESLEIDIKT